MMLSLKIPFSFLISLVIVGLIFLKDEDEQTRNSHDPGIDFDLLGDGLMTSADETMTNMTSLRFERKVPRRSEYQTASKVTLRFRKKVSAVVDLRDAIQIFHRNINPKNFKYISSSDRHQIKNKLMSETITRQPRRCALVGNSGILSESNCGPTIDAHDFVMRMNLAPSGGIYADDVGSKVSITTMNWEQMLLAVRCARNLTDDITKECTELHERMDQVGDGIIWYTKGGYVDRLGIVAGEFFQGHHGNRRHVGPRWAYSPTVMQGVCRKLWKNKNPSTGLIALSVASLFCDHISLFGFYPFEKDPRNRTISYHYYEPHSSKIFFYNKHRMPAEFRIFKMFDKHGAPGNRLVLGPCKDGITAN